MKWWFILVLCTKLLFSVDLKRVDGYKCGVKVKSRSHEGTTVDAQEWPWLASLHVLGSEKFLCGGTIVSEHHVLTAAHCLENLRWEPDQLLVYPGRHNLSESGDDHQWFIPDQVLVHPDFEWGGQSFDADVAVLFAAEPIQFSSTIAPACLWTDLSEDEDYVGTVVGWGDTGRSNRSDVPTQVQVKRVTSARCYEDYNVIAKIAGSRMFCAGSVVENYIPCKGFSGGGFFVEEDGLWYIQGIVSSTLASRFGRCDATKFTLYTKINEFLCWLNVRSDDRKISFLCEFESMRAAHDGSYGLTCKTVALSVVHQSGSVALHGKKPTAEVLALEIHKQDAVHFPNGFGALFPKLIEIGITESKLRFINRSNFENMGNVMSLMLNSNPLSNIPNDAFFDLKSLHYLEIFDCKLLKLHRNSFAENTHLKHLNISKNQLESLPSDLFRNNKNLEFFAVTDNRIKFIDDKIFANLVKLRWIDFSKNFVQNISPNAFSDLMDLTLINLDYNRLKSLHMNTFSKNIALEELYVRYNQIEELETGIFQNNQKLTHISLDNNRMSRVHEKLIVNLTSLTVISLKGMSISNLPTNLFSTLTKYETIRVHVNELTDLDKDLMSENTNLKTFNAAFNKIEKIHPSFFRNNAQLKSIKLSNNRIKSLANDFFRSLVDIEFIDLSFNDINEISLDTFEGFSNLKILKLHDNNLPTASQLILKNRYPSTRVEISSGIEYLPDQNFTNKSHVHEVLTKTDPSTCGRKVKSTGLMINGTQSEANDWPWLTSLVLSPSNLFLCGGTIVSKHHVLTAANCVNKKKEKKAGEVGDSPLQTNEFVVYLGKHNLSTTEENSKWFSPHQVIIHPDWTPGDPRYDADLAIIVAEHPIEFSDTIMPVCLWAELEEDGLEDGNNVGTVVGWGASGETNQVGNTDIPHEVQMRRVSSASCYEKHYEIASVGSSRTFCAGGVAKYSGPCTGDAGSGFYFEQSGVWFLQGIVSSGLLSNLRTCSVDKFTIFTKINEFLSWINLKNRPYDIRLRGHLTIDTDSTTTFRSVGLIVTQPSGNVILDWKKAAKVDKIDINEQSVVYLPNGFGRLFPLLLSFAIRRSNLIYIERENFDNMEHLRSLLVHSSPIKNIPNDAFAALTNLESLQIIRTEFALLHRNMFVKNTRLRQLVLYSNQIVSMPSDLFQNNLELKVIDLRHNRIRSIDSGFFVNLAKLHGVLLSDNKIHEISPRLFSPLKKLKTVELGSNRLKSLHVDTFAENQELSFLAVDFNLIKDFEPKLLRNNLKMKKLSTQFNEVKELPGDLFENLVEVKTVDLDGMKLKSLPLNFFFTLSGLQDLRLSANDFRTLHKDLLSKNTNLELFFSKFNRIEEFDSSFFRNNLKLRSIGISNNQLRSLRGGLFKGLTNVKYLDLSFNLIETIGVDAFKDLIKLEKVFIKNNNLTTLDENLFMNATNLEYIELDSNKIEHLASGLFRNNHKLTSLLFSFNRLKTIDVNFDPNRNYEHLLFFGNICVDKGFSAKFKVESQGEIVNEITSNCSTALEIEKQ